MEGGMSYAQVQAAVPSSKNIVSDPAGTRGSRSLNLTLEVR